jgi:UDP-GlcNAc:undecaprenyl-phosphate GlcNAc-1-phosphate transferase
MLLGTLIAGAAMSAASLGTSRPAALVCAALLAGLVILDTTLVTVSRRRAGRALLTGGRDHLSHRLLVRLRSPRQVALVLAAAQAALCTAALVLAQLGTAWLWAAGALAVAGCAWAIAWLESPAFEGPNLTAMPTPADASADAIEAEPITSTSARVQALRR